MHMAAPRRVYNYAEGEEERAEQAGLLCGLCGVPFVEPKTHKCGAVACMSCFTGQEQCPNCKADLVPSDVSVVPNIITNLLDKLQVHCPTCSNVFTRSRLDSHVSDCPVPCPNGCDEQVAPAQLPEHNLVCGALEYAC